MSQNSSETVTGNQPPRSVTLTMRQGPSAGQRFTVNKDSVTIGRLPDNDIAIQDQQVSRNHATITWENNQFVIRDLGSANGTTVNGVRLTGPCPLRDGDVIGLGDVILTFKGTTGMTSHGETYMRPSPPPAGIAAGPTSMGVGTIPIPPARRKSNTALWVGLGLAAVLGLVVIAGVLLLLVLPSQAGPKVSIQQPLAGSQVQVGQPLTILASVKDPKGVARVEFWVNNALEAMIPSGSPEGQKEMLVQQTWTPQSGGLHTLSLRAFNVDGKMSEPFSVVINVVGAAPAGTVTPATEATPTTPAVVMATTAAPTCVNNSAFVADVTVPDNSVFAPGARIDKTWRIRNSGTCPWQVGYQLRFVSGDKMGAPDSQAVVPTAPGGVADVTVTMYAPPAPGIYKGIWRMVSNTGELFGQSLTVLIQVPPPSTATPTVTPTSPPPPGPVVQLTADSLLVTAGNCTTVRALIQNVAAGWLDGEAIVGGYKEKSVCPCTNTTYNLEAVTTGGEHIFRSVTVNVVGVCPADKPDLVVKDLEADPPSQLKGNPINLKARIKNEGATQAVNLAVAWRPLGATWIIVADTINLAPGEDKWINWSYTYSEAGDYNTQVRVDYLNNVTESNEGNNSKDLTIQVTSLPLIPPGVLTSMAPGPFITLAPGILTALAPTPTSPILLPGLIVTVNPGIVLTAMAPGP